MRRSSRSIGANIAESWPKRRYPAHFVRCARSYVE
ncbi:MAG: four helix bundle protein [Sedimentisphaerales bacterium]|nr:four helix bundle protein [Sedimentisphaerales bacterium]